ncbi:MAG: hypothetical protein N3F04_00705 [Candidatus Nezhaarchaeota archaeon]|nr:hypothetical protein [Candidatus Nezhaarchaeota archaeon]MCX8141296.1 hypothetical protein [Candidatus Nezhaarchaeota archaeon]MDW8049562.1 hypothetical protein [Nitrososphaerota archaeon]
MSLEKIKGLSQRYVGVGLIVVGAALIVLAAVMAYFSFYGYQLPRFQAQPSGIEATIAALVFALVEVAVRLGFLGVMVWAGSVLLRYGIQALKPESIKSEQIQK